MSAVWSPEELANRFAPYIEELHEFFTFHRMPFGSSAGIGVLTERTEEPGNFRAELSALVRSMILREGGAMPHTEVLEVLAIAAGGTSINPTASELQPAMRKLLSFVGSAASRPWNEPPSEIHSGSDGKPPHPTQPKHPIEVASRGSSENAPAPRYPEDLRQDAAQPHGNQAHHAHPNNVVPFPVRGDRQRWGQERFVPHHEQRPVHGPDDLPDDIDPNPAEAFATAFGARVHAGVTAKSKAAPDSGQPEIREQAKTEPATPDVVAEAPKEMPKPSPAVANEHASDLASNVDVAAVPAAVEPHSGSLEHHARFAEHAPTDPEEFAREQEEADSDPFFADPPPPSWRNSLVAGGAVLTLLIAALISLHSHRAMQMAAQPDQVRTTPAVRSEARAAVSAPGATGSRSSEAKPGKQFKPSPYTDSDDDTDSPSSHHSHGSEDMIAEPYSSQPFLRSASATTTFPPSAQPRPTSAPSNMIASNSAPETPGGSGQVPQTAAAPPIGSSFASRSSGVPLYHPSAERSYRNPDAALAGEVPDRAPGTALEDHPQYLSLSSGVMAGNIIAAPMPDYPVLAKLAHVHGKVIVQAVIDKEGNVSAAKVLSGNRLLRGAAVDAVRQWRYKPYVQQGKAVDVSTIITVEFRTPVGG